MFVCSAGMSTSLLVSKVNTLAQAKGLDLQIYALGEAEARRNLAQAHVLLLGPQVRYLEQPFRKSLQGTGVKLGVVDMLAYGRMDSEKVLNQIMSLLNSPQGC